MKRYFFAAFIVLTLASQSACISQDVTQDWAAVERESGGVSLRLLVPKIPDPTGRAPLRIVIVNNSDGEIVYTPATEPSTLFRITIKPMDKDGKAGESVPLSAVGNHFFDVRGKRVVQKSLKKGASVAFMAHLDRLFKISTPGKYVVEVTFQANQLGDPTKKIWFSCSTEFTVIEEKEPAFHEDSGTGKTHNAEAPAPGPIDPNQKNND